MRALLIGQCVFAGVAFAAALVLPRPGQALLLVPLHGGAALGGAMQESRAFRLVAPGRIAGSVVVRSDGTVPVVRLLMRGILPFAVPIAACGRLKSSPS